MSEPNIVTNTDGVNAVRTRRPLARLYCGYGTNTAETGGAQNTWYDFTFPSTPITTYRNQDFSVSTSGTIVFTYTGTTPRWFRVAAVCNVKKASGGGASRTVQFQWKHNGTLVGTARESHMNRDTEIVSGEGELYLSNGDTLTPAFQNVENAEAALLWNCSFDITEAPEYTWCD